jgi:alpha-ketoglutarate-dependent taurine dioxygenase
MVEVRDRLDTGCGFCVLDGLPMDQYPVPDLIACFWVIGQWLGRPVAQTWQGDMLYEVTDTGEAYRYGVRGSRTRVELFFHTDNAFGRSPPHYVGLFCCQPAMEGGVSRFCSLYTLHNRLLERYPQLLARLYQPLLFDRQGEHAEGAARTAEMPFFAWDGKRLQARVNVSLVRKGYDVAGRDIPKELDDALNAVEEVLCASDMWLEAPLERGQLQYLNNLDIGHYRSGFTDSAASQARRHLYRTWHRDVGQQTYDG